MHTREISIDSAGLRLAGTLALPEGTGAHPGAVLLHGALWGLRGFYRAFAEVFAEAGIASLAFDRRGEGESAGPASMELDLLAADAVAALEVLRVQPEIDPGRAGLWGYSNGAWVAGLAASRARKPSFLVLTGASGVSPAASEVFRRAEELRSRGVPDSTVTAVERAWTIIFDYMVNGTWDESWDAQLAGLRLRIDSDPLLAALPSPEFVRDNPALDAVPRFDGPFLRNLKTRLKGSRPDMGFDPMNSLATLSCPVLVVLAENDANLPIALSLPRFQALAARRGAAWAVEVLAGADHLFSRDHRSERTNPEVLRELRSRGQFIPGYLDLMASWMARQSSMV